MKRGKQEFSWLYLFQPEDTTTVAPSQLAGLCKVFLWVGVSFVMSVGISQLT